LYDILQLKTPRTNIGNYFIEIGSKTIIDLVRPNYNVLQISGTGRIFFEYSKINIITKTIRKINHKTNIINSLLGHSRNHILNKYYYSKKDNNFLNNFYDFSLNFKSKYVILSGCILNKYTIERFGKSLLDFKNKGSKIILLGSGGEDYNKLEVNLVKEYLEKLKPYAIITRDDVAYNFYNKYSEYSYSGIDSAFFIEDYIKKLKIFYDNPNKYVIFTFDKINEPKIITSKNVIRLHHSFLGVAELFPSLQNSYYNRPNTFVSDSALEYLILYYYADKVYTDRVHACIASLTFNHPCKLFYETPRTYLLKKVNINEFNKIMLPDKYTLKKEKNKELNFIDDILYD
jgi:hypothetical protein